MGYRRELVKDLGTVPSRRVRIVMAGVVDVLKVDVMDGVKIGSTVAVGPLFCYRRTAPAPQGQSLPASLMVGAAQGAHCHD